MKPEILTRDENQKLDRFECPDCGARNTLIFGPRGGMAQNVVCGICKTEFNKGIARSERTFQPCPEDRQRVLYQLDKFPVDGFCSKPPMALNKFKQMRCQNPDCKHEGCECYVQSGCHTGSGTIAAYNTQEEVLTFYCAVCRRPIVKVKL
jgi:hypothetical protein